MSKLSKNTKEKIKEYVLFTLGDRELNTNQIRNEIARGHKLTNDILNEMLKEKRVSQLGDKWKRSNEQ